VIRNDEADQHRAVGRQQDRRGERRGGADSFSGQRFLRHMEISGYAPGGISAAAVPVRAKKEEFNADAIEIGTLKASRNLTLVPPKMRHAVMQ
jgi:hypothetical protein